MTICAQVVLYGKSNQFAINNCPDDAFCGEAMRSGVDLAWEKRGCVTPSLSLLGKGGGIFVGGLQYPSKLRQYDFLCTVSALRGK